jgi:hypothetical protein
MAKKCGKVAEFELESFGVKLKMCEIHKQLTLTIITPSKITTIKKYKNKKCQIEI